MSRSMNGKMDRGRQGNTEGVPLVRAALQAGVGYLVLRDAAMRGLVRGWQDEKRHWFIDPASLATYIAWQRRRDRAGSAPQPAARVS